jgi:ABC-type amino acid transport system permease subunit
MDFGFTNTEWFFGTMIMDKLNEIYGFQVVVNNLGNFAMGAVLTLEITFFSILIGMVLGLLIIAVYYHIARFVITNQADNS